MDTACFSFFFFFICDVLNMVIVNVMLFPYIDVPWNFHRFDRQTEEEMNHCAAPV